MKLAEKRKNWLLLAFLTETICVTYALKLKMLTGITSILFTISGLLIVWLSLRSPKPHVYENKPFDLSKTINRYRWWILGMALISISGSALHWMDDAPLDYHDGDMLPIIKIMSERFVHGAWSHVYDVIPEIWNGMHPIYLPAMWLPFSIPVFFDADPRWMTIAALFLVVALFIWRIHPLHKHAAPMVFAAFLLVWWLLNAENSGLVPYTEEGVVIAFYSLLTIALLGKNSWMIGLSLSLCILSRYSVVGWVPAMLLFYLFNKSYQDLFRFCLTGIICFCLLVLLPFGWSTFLKLAAVPSEYIGFSKRVWHDAPVVFRESLGWAKFFGPDRIALQHHLLVGSALSMPTVFMGLGLWLQKKLRFNGELLPIASLKFTLVLFYTLVDVPYLYLFIPDPS